MRPQAPLRPGNAWRAEEFTSPTPLCTINERAIPTMVDAQQLACMPIPRAPVPRLPARRSLPLSAVEELAPTYDHGLVDQYPPGPIPFFDPQQGRQANSQGNTLRTRFPLGNSSPSHNDFQWRCSVKNSFLHVEMSDNSDEEPDDSWDGGSSQRSSSVPSRQTHDELRASAPDWHRRQADLTNQGFQLEVAC